MVMNGPTPIMSIMLSAVAEERLRPRTSCGLLSEAVVEEVVMKLAGGRRSSVVGRLENE
jgi:hypothetical protein